MRSLPTLLLLYLVLPFHGNTSPEPQLHPSQAHPAQPDYRLPSNMPRHSNAVDVDDFLDDLVNVLVANNIHHSRCTFALMACCSTSSDATWVRESLFNLPWEEACNQFSRRFRDPMRAHRLQADFYHLRKLSGESILDFSTKFQKFVDRLRLSGPTLVPRFIDCLSNPLLIFNYMPLIDLS